MKLTMILALCLLCAGCEPREGVSVANPVTRFNLDVPNRVLKLENNKDVDLEVEGVRYTGSDGSEFVVPKMKVSDKASSVREANVGQLGAYTQLAAANWAGAAEYTRAWADLTRAIGDALAQVMPYVPKTVAAQALGQLGTSQQVQTPLGTVTRDSALSKAQIDLLLQIAGSATRPAQ